MGNLFRLCFWGLVADLAAEVALLLFKTLFLLADVVCLEAYALEKDAVLRMIAAIVVMLNFIIYMPLTYIITVYTYYILKLY